MNRFSTALVCSVALALAGTPLQASEAQGKSVDVVHFWVSKSEAAALDVFRQDWNGMSNRWVDLPAENKVAVQRIVSDRIASGYPPAVMQWNANEGARELPDMGVLQDIEPVAQLQKWRDVLPPFVIDRISYRDRIYFAPTNIHAENWLWTSQALFDELDLSTPATWDEIFAAAERMQAAGKRPLALGSGSWEVSLLFNDIMYYKMGAEGYARIIGADAEAVLDPRMLEALDMLRRLSRYAESAQERSGKTWADASAMVGRGEAGMQFMGDWAKGELLHRGFGVDKDFGCALVPGTAIAYFMVIDAFAFPLLNREGGADAQQAFAGVLLDRTNQVEFSRIKGSLPVRTDVDPNGLDRCGQIGLQQLVNDDRRVSAQSMAMPSQMSEGWIGILSDFFNDTSMSSESARQRLYEVVKQG